MRRIDEHGRDGASVTTKPHAPTKATAVVLACLAAAAGLVPAAADPPASTHAGYERAAPALHGPPKLSLPVDWLPGETCFVQSHVDLDPGPGARDYRCGSATYDGHKGVDFRLRSVAASRDGVAVLAAADGVVKRLRDGMEDALVTKADRALVARRGCGNSVLIEHGGGWQTVYCHMRNGSLVVRPGDVVRRGQRIGDVGYSGLAEFAHLHLMVMHEGEVVDPVSGLHLGDACSAADESPPSGTLWDELAASAFAYRNGEFIGAGFSGRQVGTSELELDHRVASPDPASKAFLFYARLINLRAGDRVGLSVRGPSGFVVEHATAPLDRNKATYVAFAGRRLRAARWPPGTYQGMADLIRGGKTIARSAPVRLTLP